MIYSFSFNVVINRTRMPPTIAVFGAGVVGLSTAVGLQQAIPEAIITIIADKFGDETLSHGAGGIFRPVVEKTPGVEYNRLMRWLRSSWKHYDTLAHSEDAGEAGVQIISGYHYFNTPREDPLYKDIVYGFRKQTSAEMNMFPGPKYTYGWFVTTIMTQGAYYTAYLMKKFLRGGGLTEKKKINSFEEFVGPYDVVVNCTGMGSYWLLNDHRLVALRGHLVKIRAPWIKQFLYTGENTDCYILPGSELVSVGGTHQPGDFSTEPRAQDKKGILERAYTVMPSLKRGTIDHEWVGLRPFRNPLRLETEVMTFPQGKLRVVHNYGHGAEGISLSWGTSEEAVQLVIAMLNRQPHLHAKL